MAISRDKKETLVAELEKMFADAVGCAGASYSGLSVADLQDLRSVARQNSVTIRVVKNRLVRVALAANKKFAGKDTSLLSGQLIYAFSNEDEIAPAQVLATFGKTHPQLQLTVGFTGDGAVLDTATIVAMSKLPTKDQLKGQFVSVLAAPLTRLLGVANGTQRGLTRVLSERAAAL